MKYHQRYTLYPPPSLTKLQTTEIYFGKLLSDKWYFDFSSYLK